MNWKTVDEWWDEGPKPGTWIVRVTLPNKPGHWHIISAGKRIQMTQNPDHAKGYASRANAEKAAKIFLEDDSCSVEIEQV
ncbi:hypothetical protein QK382_31685 [Pseudomonas aeruginosa]|uniref:hypothetical protein n=1 Tax=Pseudomonas aeruginosa TaxID=287 RepID=UPI001E31F22E|nr:hypothetical protein [Pseudomonas aeruginosa]MCO2924035.1 hypothetical protein [Pseudomonas aeruginosa]MCO2924037.1 hypothetical protein [Pseudomonas aeruginosa]MDI3896222.1 hypothetical protein [Pseudomonas aeruginosa]UFM92436.1 hypothetical protein LO758_15945 [Pseudomonas aeruginosa]UFM92445.1 hypothetical protein LO758_15995 [Pseudomonas aeruginosa]